jgi:hypothetical protein
LHFKTNSHDKIWHPLWPYLFVFRFQKLWNLYMQESMRICRSRWIYFYLIMHTCIGCMSTMDTTMLNSIPANHFRVTRSFICMALNNMNVMDTTIQMTDSTHDIYMPQCGNRGEHRPSESWKQKHIETVIPRHPNPCPSWISETNN